MKILALFLSYSEEVRSNADSCQLRQPGQGAVCTSSPMGMGWISDTVGEAGQGAVYTSSPLGTGWISDTVGEAGPQAASAFSLHFGDAEPYKLKHANRMQIIIYLKPERPS